MLFFVFARGQFLELRFLKERLLLGICITQTVPCVKSLFQGKALFEYKLYVIGFVPADVVRLKEDVWFEKMNAEQMSLIENFLSGCM